MAALEARGCCVLFVMFRDTEGDIRVEIRIYGRNIERLLNETKYS